MIAIITQGYGSLTPITQGYGGVGVIPPPTPTPSGGGIGAIVLTAKCKKRKKRRELLAEKTTVSLTEVGNLLVPTVLICADKNQTPWARKRKRLQVTSLILNDFDIIESEKELRR